MSGDRGRSVGEVSTGSDASSSHRVSERSTERTPSDAKTKGSSWSNAAPASGAGFETAASNRETMASAPSASHNTVSYSSVAR